MDLFDKENVGPLTSYRDRDRELEKEKKGRSDRERSHIEG